jgi:uncharacterized glyoxalase superfamily protein PhnB
MERALAAPSGLRSQEQCVIAVLTVKNTVESAAWYQRAFGAELVHRMPTPDESATWHAEMRIGNTFIFIHDEMPGPGGKAPTPGVSPSAGLWLNVHNSDDAFRTAMSQGAKVVMPVMDMFWGDRCGMVVDPFGYLWCISTHQRDVSHEEMQAGAEQAWSIMQRGAGHA